MLKDIDEKIQSTHRNLSDCRIGDYSISEVSEGVLSTDIGKMLITPAGSLA